MSVHTLSRNLHLRMNLGWLCQMSRMKCYFFSASIITLGIISHVANLSIIILHNIYPIFPSHSPSCPGLPSPFLCLNCLSWSIVSSSCKTRGTYMHQSIGYNSYSNGLPLQKGLNILYVCNYAIRTYVANMFAGVMNNWSIHYQHSMENPLEFAVASSLTRLFPLYNYNP